ncbi:DNA-3-methyladenine glycosylase I [Niveibacterium sp. COAC-50]|uniref:DNA-3-methyladenine glycosylase I n=1 Tax=Niveibacterium sp. COAC-50 TaxID=2729384 RepID=UPI001556EB13|nr:DNA-3-methyladenine glycosylase I [Niveibacterium sp. COAC-50]
MCDAPARCTWVTSDPLYLDYHDTEWGVPLADANALFECLTLEGAQAGLSWLTILRKREGYRRAFAGFDPAKVARFSDDDVTRLLADPGIVRHRGKIEATIGNARAWLALQNGGADPVKWLWSFVDGRPQSPAPGAAPQATNEVSDQMSRALRKAGFRFVGSTTCYAFMQAVGMVNDHAEGCFRRNEVAQSAASFRL